jgi:hypothetical protein
MPVPPQGMSFPVTTLNAEAPKNCVVKPFKARMLAPGEISKPDPKYGHQPNQVQAAVTAKKDDGVNTSSTKLYPAALVTVLFNII